MFHLGFSQEQSQNSKSETAKEAFVGTILNQFSDCIREIKDGKIFLFHDRIISTENGLILLNYENKKLPLHNVSSSEYGSFVEFKKSELDAPFTCTHCGYKWIAHPIMRTCPNCGFAN